MKLHIVTLYSKAILILLGIVVLMGWLFHIPSLVRIWPGMVGMVPNTALCFIFVGTTLFIQEAVNNGKRNTPLYVVHYLLLTFIILIALSSFFEDFMRFNLKINDWLATDWLRDMNPTPGRMAPSSSIAFILYAIIVLMIPLGDSKSIAILIQLLSLFILLIGIVSLLIYGMELEFIFDWYKFTKMAVHTACGFIITSVALFCTWRQSPWYKQFYEKKDDKKILVSSGIILLLITLISGLGGVADLTALSIRTTHFFLEYALKNRVNQFIWTLTDIQSDIDVFIKEHPVITNSQLNDVSNLDKITPYLLNKGFNALKIVDSGGNLIYARGNFIKNPEMEVPLKLPQASVLIWQQGFWLKTKTPLYDNNKHILQGYLIAEIFLAKQTHEYMNYKNLGQTGEVLICYYLKSNEAECFPSRFTPQKHILEIKNIDRTLSISHAFLGLTGAINNLDYRGKNVVSAYGPIGDIGLGIVIEINAAELFKPMGKHIQIITCMCILLILLGLILQYWQVAPLVKKLLSSEKIAQENEEKVIEANEALIKRNKDIHLLQELSSYLHSCLDLEEAYSLIERYANQLLLDFKGSFYLMHESRNYLECVFDWANPRFNEKVLKPDQCWAIRRGYIHQVADLKTELVCPHSKNVGITDVASICIPMMAKNDIIGLLYLEWRAPPIENASLLSAQKVNMAVAFSEQISLAISNIKLRERLRNQSLRDPLTGLYNRRYLEETIDRELFRSKRDSSSLAFLMIDIDHFKTFNDTFGHTAGDIVLQSFGGLLNKFLRKGDMSCRLGGEEFALVLSNISVENAVQRAQELNKRVSNLHIVYEGNTLGLITISIGVAMYPDHGKNLEELSHFADKALYEAKQNGRNRTIVFSPT
jgi:diguanylate cyclase (GGDEF)-like protein